MRSLLRLFVTDPFRDLAQRPRANIPALDALRCLAVVLVITAHFSSAFAKGGGTSNWLGRLPIVTGGRVGVDLFFVLSGYLIGSQLWRELGAKKTINLRKFMIRRIFRIWPLYFFFFFFVTFVLHPELPSWRGWSDLVFLTNYVDHGVVLGSWSLCTEEQFYIVAPLLVLIGSCWCWSTRFYGRILLGLLIALPCIRAITWWWATGDFQHRNPSAFAHYLYQPFHTHADGLVVGLLIAFYRQFNETSCNQGFLASGRGVLAAMVLFGVGHWLQREVFDFLGIALLFGAVVQYCLSHSPRWLSFVSFSGFYVISRLSFGMYLNHEYLQEMVAGTMLYRLPSLGGIPAIQEIIGAAFLVLISALLAVVTFCLIEHPFLHIREMILRRGEGKSARKQESHVVGATGDANSMLESLASPDPVPVLIPANSGPRARPQEMQPT